MAMHKKKKAPMHKKHKEMEEKHEHMEKHHEKEHEKHDKKKSPAKKKMKKAMKEFEHGELHSGSKKGPTVTNPKQAVAIAYSEAKKAKKKRK